MWRTSQDRADSAARRLSLALELWGWSPHETQRSLFCSLAQVSVAACGRRWGKTECLSADIATLALDELAQGRDVRQLVVAPSDSQARLIGNEVLRLLLVAWDKKTPTTAGVGFLTRQRPSLTLTLSKGEWTASLIFHTAGRDGRGLRGLWAHRIVVDEGAYVPDSVLNDVLMPMLLDKGGDYLLASSPNGKRSAYYRMFARASSGSEDSHGITYAAHQFPTATNPYLDLAFLHSQREEMGEAMYAQEYGAQFLDVGGSVFRDDDIDAAMVTDARVRLEDGALVSEPRAGRLYTVGIDWGRKLDFTVVAVLDATETPARLVYLRRWQGTGWEAQIEDVAAVVARFDPWAVLADGNSIGDPLIERLQTVVRRRVLAGDPGARVPPLERFLFTQDSKQQLVDRLNLRLSSRALTFPAHRALLAELRAFEYGLVGQSGRPRMGARPGAHDDTVMGLALAVFAAPDGAPVALGSQILLGSSVGGMRRGA